jgi:hypothetical protein
MSSVSIFRFLDIIKNDDPTNDAFFLERGEL